MQWGLGRGCWSPSSSTTRGCLRWKVWRKISAWKWTPSAAELQQPSEHKLLLPRPRKSCCPAARTVRGAARGSRFENQVGCPRMRVTKVAALLPHARRFKAAADRCPLVSTGPQAERVCQSGGVGLRTAGRAEEFPTRRGSPHNRLPRPRCSKTTWTLPRPRIRSFGVSRVHDYV